MAVPASVAPLPASFRRWEAAVLSGPDALRLSELPLAAPKPGEVLLRVLATDATYTDLLVLTGSAYASMSGAQTNPFVPGCACSALVAAVGADAAHAFAVGDAVLALGPGGCAAEFLALPARACIKVEDAALKAFVRARPELAAALPLTGVTAYQMLHRVAGASRLRAADASVLVTGAAGGTGSMLVQLAKLAGVVPARIVGTCSRKNLEAVKALGATPVCYEDADWPAQARAATGGAGFCAAFDCAALANYGACVSLLASGGVYTAFGLTLKDAAAGTMPMTEVLPLFAQCVSAGDRLARFGPARPRAARHPLSQTRLTFAAPRRFGFRHSVLHGIFGASDASFYSIADRRKELPEDFKEDLLALLALASSGRLEVVVGAVHEFFEVKAALKGIAEGKHRAKQMIRVSQA
jgi:NADPH2:quinone reductase